MQHDDCRPFADNPNMNNGAVRLNSLNAHTDWKRLNARGSGSTMAIATSTPNTMRIIELLLKLNFSLRRLACACTGDEQIQQCFARARVFTTDLSLISS
jgi:hypothetical protein